MRSTAILLALSLFGTGCVDDTSRDETPLQAAPDPSASYRVVVAFASLGAGIDTDAHQQLLAYVGAHDIDLSPDEFSWGLEGERNLCFTLHGLNPQAQALFVTEVDAIAASSSLVTVHENASCNLIGRN